MTDVTATSMASGKRTTPGLELFGWCMTVAWTDLMSRAYTSLGVGNVGFGTGEMIETTFFLLLALSVIVTSLWCGRDLIILSRIATWTTPLALVMTVGFVFLPLTSSIGVYLLVAILIGPGLTRRMYGVIRTGDRGNRITRFVVGWALGAVVLAVWMAIPQVSTVSFLIAAVFAVVSLLGLHRVPAPVEQFTTGATVKSSPGSRVVFISTLVILAIVVELRGQLINQLSIGSVLTSSADQGATALWRIPTSIGLVVFALVSDRGLEWLGVAVGMALLIIGLVGSILVSGDPNHALLFTVQIIITFGGGYPLFFFLSFPLHFFEASSRPVFVAAGGSLFYFAYDSLGKWVGSLSKWIAGPAPLSSPGSSVVVVAAILFVIAFWVMAYVLFNRFAERSLAATLASLLHGDRARATVIRGLISRPTAYTSIQSPVAGEDSAEGTLTSHEVVPESFEALSSRVGEMSETGGQALVDDGAQPGETASTDRPPSAAPVPYIMPELLSEKEMAVALLLIEGQTRYAISRRLNEPVADVNVQVEAIRDKIIRRGDPDPGVSAAIQEYTLTRREADTLRCLCQGMTNPQIADDLTISEETVKKHVRSLMAKLPVNDRADVPGLVMSLRPNTQVHA
ncbi:MAG: helix-turn-helix transcriptional regulator [Propionibacteriaceae bacterium]|nr:helix-turn-helix transcriptional regulator [Propionibacteriaceae bacterium]